MRTGKHIKLSKHASRNRLFLILGIIFVTISFISLAVFSYALLKIDVAPIKYLATGYTLIFIIFLILIWVIFGKTNKFVKVIAFIVTIMMSSFLGYSTVYLTNTYNFLNSAKVSEYETLTYSVVALNDTNYRVIDNLNKKTISYLNDDYKSDIRKELNDNINYQEILNDELGSLPTILLDRQVDAIIIENTALELMREENIDFSNSIKIVHTFNVRVRTHKEEVVTTIDVKQEPFILYISGIDQYGNVNSVRGRSDVNQIVIVNPKTNHILLANTPRDFYVQLAGTSGLKDKLTHAGLYGIDKSINTLESIYGININHYLRVNFDTLIKVVDEIGGIEIYSDKAFVPFTNRNVYVNEGWNHMDGTLALAYARERYTYVTGDHHRGANQQQVITAIINKVSTSEVLIKKYNSILNTLSGSFQTDMEVDMITSFIKYQLDKMPKWTIESIAATGYNSSNYTHSMGLGVKLYVMEPDYNSIERVKVRINEVLNGE